MIKKDQPRIAAGAKVTVNGQEGTALGEVLEVFTPDNLPKIHEQLKATDPAATAQLCPPPAAVAAAMKDLGIDQIAAIAHHHAGRPVWFYAFRNTNGEWYDEKGKQLIITPQ